MELKGKIREYLKGELGTLFLECEAYCETDRARGPCVLGPNSRALSSLCKFSGKVVL
jgi:hypothetical protein